MFNDDLSWCNDYSWVLFRGFNEGLTIQHVGICWEGPRSKNVRIMGYKLGKS